MTSSRRWMILTLALTLAAGASLGVVGDRLVSDDRSKPTAESKRDDGVIWFPCDDSAGSRDDEEGADSEAKPRDRESKAEHSARHAARRERRMESLRSELNLDDEQVEQLQEVLRLHGRAARGFWKKTRQEYCGMRERLHDDARALLRPEQLPLFEERQRRLEKKAAIEAPFRAASSSRGERTASEQRPAAEENSR